MADAPRLDVSHPRQLQGNTQEKAIELIEAGNGRRRGKDRGSCWREQYWPAGPEPDAHGVIAPYRHLSL